jgi:hypothetical protein
MRTRDMFGGNDEEEVAVGGCYGGDDCDTFASPATSSYAPKGSFPRNQATASTACPLKPKNQMVKVMQNIHATLKENCKIANKVMICEHLDEVIKEVQSMAVRCGAKEGSTEHFMTTEPFKKVENRSSFKAFETDEGTLLWLKRHCACAGLM